MNQKPFIPSTGRLRILLSEDDSSIRAELTVMYREDYDNIDLKVEIFDEGMEINIYNGREEFEVMRTEDVMLISKAYADIVTIAELLQSSFPRVHEKLRPYVDRK